MELRRVTGLSVPISSPLRLFNIRLERITDRLPPAFACEIRERNKIAETKEGLHDEGYARRFRLVVPER